MRLAVKVAVVVMVLAAASYLFAYPTRTYLEQRQQIALEERTISVLRTEDAKLASESEALQTNATIEQIARQEYGLVMPGQQAFMVLPSLSRPVDGAPVPHRHSPWYSSLEFWHRL